MISGLVQLYRQVGGELFTTSHGRVLLLKTVAVAAMIFVGMTAQQLARSRLARANELTVRTADRLRRAFGTEAVIGVVVIMLSGWMLTMTPGKVPDAGIVELRGAARRSTTRRRACRSRCSSARAGSVSTTCGSR